jgi:hypothetical protein
VGNQVSLELSQESLSVFFESFPLGFLTIHMQPNKLLRILEAMSVRLLRADLPNIAATAFNVSEDPAWKFDAIRLHKVG